MKNALYILTLMILGCSNQSKQIDKQTLHYTTQDTVFIPTELGDTIRFGREEYNRVVVDAHPEFFRDIGEDPDKLYYRLGGSVDFGSEQGQDVYYILYAHFLKQQNGVEKYAQQRKTLIGIYSQINSLFEHLEYGGTYFGHQRSRILGYAEYSILLYPRNKNEIEKTYDISKQKTLYIKSLRQLITDESEIDYETLDQEKAERTKKLNEIVRELDRLITGNFYLRRAQEFHYTNYQYY